MQPAIRFARRDLQFAEVFVIQQTHGFVQRSLAEVLLKVG
jgi:hypothetical protein